MKRNALPYLAIPMAIALSAGSLFAWEIDLANCAVILSPGDHGNNGQNDWNQIWEDSNLWQDGCGNAPQLHCEGFGSFDPYGDWYCS